jgi:hypothetical protein
MMQPQMLLPQALWSLLRMQRQHKLVPLLSKQAGQLLVTPQHMLLAPAAAAAALAMARVMVRLQPPCSCVVVCWLMWEQGRASSASQQQHVATGSLPLRLHQQAWQLSKPVSGTMASKTL